MSLLAQASYHFLKIRTVLLWEKLACSTRWKKYILIQEINLEMVCERPVGSLPQCGCGGLGLLVNSHSQTCTEFRSVQGEGGVRLDGAQAIFAHRDVLFFIFLSVVWIEPLQSREWDSLPQRWLEAGPLGGVFHNKRALMKKVQPVAECHAFDRPVNRYKWFNTLGHFSRCWGA